MATYTPATLITSKVVGNGAANIATWRYQNTGGAGTFGIVRNTVFCAPVAARVITLEQGSVAADTAAQKILDAYAFGGANVPWIQSWWLTVQNSDYFEGFANNTDIVGAAYGVTSV